MRTVVILSADEAVAPRLAEWSREVGHRCVERVEPDLFSLDAKRWSNVISEEPDSFVIVAGSLGRDLERTVKTLRLLFGAPGILVVGGRSDEDGDGRVVRRGADAHLATTVGRERFQAAVERTNELARLRSELHYLRRRDAQGAEIGRMVGGCAAMQEIFHKVLTLCRRTVRSRMPAVLITGETGSGKGQIARAIHYNGTRRDQALVEVNCASLLDTLIEVELFGCEQGAYTGASKARPGLFEVAHGGTLFLDEIGTLGLDLQAKLLRFLDEHTVRRLGSTSERALDVQFIAATHRDLAAAVKQGGFREDLFFRLHTIHLHLPPLRERERDAVDLALGFLEELRREYGREPMRLAAAAEQAILAYTWPGNIRELRNRLERIVLLSDRLEITPEALELPSGSVVGASVRDSLDLTLPPGGVNLEEVERTLIDEAMRQTGGNVSRAARLLGLTRSALRYRLGR